MVFARSLPPVPTLWGCKGPWALRQRLCMTWLNIAPPHPPRLSTLLWTYFSVFHLVMCSARLFLFHPSNRYATIKSIQPNPTLPGGLVGGPRAYQDQFRGFKYRRVHTRRDFLLPKKWLAESARAWVSNIRWKSTSSGNAEPYICSLKMKARTGAGRRDDPCDHGSSRRSLRVKNSYGLS